MNESALQRVSKLITDRNAIDAEIGAITDRPVVAGHLGEWIAAQVFDITLEESAVAKAIDGRFASGPLAGQTVNVKWYGKREGLLDMVDDPRLDHYLVMTGPRSSAGSSRGGTRPLLIESVYLFRSSSLLQALRERGVKIGVATSVVADVWDAAELFPTQRNAALPLTPEQRKVLSEFATSRKPGDG